jgi:hypothetical protein
MRKAVLLYAAALILSSFFLVSCGELEVAAAAKQPVITSISPATMEAGSPGFTLTVRGRNFRDHSVVIWEGQPKQTTKVKGTLQATIEASAIARPKNARVSVRTLKPRVLDSLAFIFVVTEPPPPEEDPPPEPEPHPPPEPEPDPPPEPEPDPPPEPEPEPPPPGVLPALVAPCTADFDPRQIPIELQAWWVPNFGHVHASACLPLGQVVVNELNFNVRVVLHDNPSQFDEFGSHDDNSFQLRLFQDPPKVCPFDGTTETNCAWNIPVRWNFQELGIQNGERELRIRAQTVTPDGNDFLNSSGIPIFVEGGVGSRSDYQRWCQNDQGISTSLIGRGWYDGFGYTAAIIECVPQAPVSGTWTVRVRAARNESSRLTAALSKSHAIPAVGPWPAIPVTEGRLILDQSNPGTGWYTLEIETTTLQNGWHSLAVKSVAIVGGSSDCSFCNGETNHPAGVAKAWFFVQN